MGKRYDDDKRKIAAFLEEMRKYAESKGGAFSLARGIEKDLLRMGRELGSIDLAIINARKSLTEAIDLAAESSNLPDERSTLH